MYLSFLELWSAPGVPFLSLLCCQFSVHSLSPHPTAGRRGQPVCNPVLVQQRHSPAQRVPTAVEDTEGRRDGGDVFDHRQGSGTVETASGRAPKYIDKVKGL